MHIKTVHAESKSFKTANDAFDYDCEKIIMRINSCINKQLQVFQSKIHNIFLYR